MKKRVLALITVVFATFLISSCDKGWDAEEQKVIDHQIIEQYAKEKGLNGQFTDSGLYYEILVPGTDAKPNLSCNVTVKYKGYYTDGEVFDEGTVNDYPLSRLIEGWREGIPYIGKGGKMILVIPSHLGYGHNPQGDIKSDAVLVFDVQLIDFTY